VAVARTRREYMNMLKLTTDPQTDFVATPATVAAASGHSPARASSTSMSRPPGPLQLKLLGAMRRHGRATSLGNLAALVLGLILDLEARPPYGWVPPRATYVSVARAVAGLRRRGLVDTEVAGTRKGRLEWPQNSRPVWRFRHPGKRLIVRACVDSLVPKQ
jgi:hypothetical protein